MKKQRFSIIPDEGELDNRQVLVKKFIPDAYIKLNDYVVVAFCRFDGCIVELSTQAKRVCIVESRFEYCRLIGAGWPPELIQQIQQQEKKN